MREMDDLHLANIKELQLKSKYDFDTMLHLVQAREIGPVSFTIDKSSMGVQRNLLSTIQNWAISLKI